MNDKATADLRAATLSVTLAAARNRRVTRRVRAAAGLTSMIGAVLWGLIASIEPRSVTPPAAPLASHSSGVEVIRTRSKSVARVRTISQASTVEVQRTGSKKVDRIDRSELAELLPGHEIILVGNM